MTDEKTLAEEEHVAFLTGDVEKMELIRNARRYLALRESGVIVDLKPDACWLFAGKLDKAADRLLEGGE